MAVASEIFAKPIDSAAMTRKSRQACRNGGLKVDHLLIDAQDWRGAWSDRLGRANDIRPSQRTRLNLPAATSSLSGRHASACPPLEGAQGQAASFLVVRRLRRS